MSTITESIKDRRATMGLTQRELADKAGIRQATICAIESGTEPTNETLIKLSAAMDGKALITPSVIKWRKLPK